MSFVILYLYISSAVYASSVESRYLRSMAAARSTLDVDELKADYERLKIAQTACKIQLQEHTVPAACYEALDLELKGDSIAPARKAEFIRKLDHLCTEAAGKLRLSTDSGRFISNECAKKIRQARTIQAYRDEWSGN